MNRKKKGYPHKIVTYTYIPLYPIKNRLVMAEGMWANTHAKAMKKYIDHSDTFDNKKGEYINETRIYPEKVLRKQRTTYYTKRGNR